MKDSNKDDLNKDKTENKFFDTLEFYLRNNNGPKPIFETSNRIIPFQTSHKTGSIKLKMEEVYEDNKLCSYYQIFKNLIEEFENEIKGQHNIEALNKNGYISELEKQFGIPSTNLAITPIYPRVTVSEDEYLYRYFLNQRLSDIIPYHKTFINPLIGVLLSKEINTRLLSIFEAGCYIYAHIKEIDTVIFEGITEMDQFLKKNLKNQNSTNHWNLYGKNSILANSAINGLELHLLTTFIDSLHWTCKQKQKDNYNSFLIILKDIKKYVVNPDQLSTEQILDLNGLLHGLKSKNIDLTSSNYTIHINTGKFQHVFYLHIHLTLLD